MSPQARVLSRSRLLRFVIVGVGAAVLFFALAFCFARLGMQPFLSSAIAYLIAFVMAYTAQRGWTFHGEQDHRTAFPRYLTLQLGCSAFSGLVSQIAVSGFGATPFAMSLVATLLTSAVSYMLSSRWVFAKRSF